MELGNEQLAKMHIEAQSILLSQERLAGIQPFWNKLPLKARWFLLGTAYLLDGRYEQATKFLSSLTDRFSGLYNYLLLHRKLQSQQAKDLESQLLSKFPLEYELQENQVLNRKIAYFVLHMGSTGGMRMIQKQKNLLQQNGFEVQYFLPYPKKGVSLQTELFNSPFEAKTFERDEDIDDIAAEYDIAISTLQDLNFPLFSRFKKTFYYSQGEYNLYFGYKDCQQEITLFHLLPVHIYTVSNFLSELLENRFSRKCFIHPCDVNPKIFYPGDKAEKPLVLVMGNGAEPLKGIHPVINALLKLNAEMDFNILWISPNREDDHRDQRVQIIYQPDQSTLAAYLRGATIFVSGSAIESFSLPPLEAMSSGTVVVAADSGGIHEYGKHNHNLLLFDFGDWAKVKEYVSLLLTDPGLRHRLIENGLKTASDYTPEILDMRFISYFHSALQDKVITRY